MMKKKYYIVVDMTRVLLKEKEYIEGGFLYVGTALRILKKNMKNLMNMEELGKVGKNSYLLKKNIALVFLNLKNLMKKKFIFLLYQ